MIKTSYPESVHRYKGSYFYIVRRDGVKSLAITKPHSGAASAFEGETVRSEDGGRAIKLCPLNTANGKALMAIFPFTRPSSYSGKKYTAGLGDRLGLASPGHIRAVKGTGVFPVLAQQSLRELTLTGRTYDDVLAAAAWAVFQEDHREGYGADGDHLKTAAEISMALNSGFTMITLDCSEHIDNAAAGYTAAEAEAAYAAISPAVRQKFEQKYLGTAFDLGPGASIAYTPAALAGIVLVYRKALLHAVEIYEKCIKSAARQVDFEISIDETLTPTSPEAHYFVARELLDAGVEIANMAPRFCGEFQKGIDYIGEVERFEREYAVHAAIATHFGYRISIHSGSDKFSIFPFAGKLSKNGLHLKTAGTNWLEAVRVIAKNAPALYRELHEFSLAHLAQARKYYHINGDPANVAPLSELTDEQLPDLMNLNDSRQIIHICYGVLLSAKDDSGAWIFRDRIMDVLDQYEDDYASALEYHIGRHFDSLGIR